MAPDCPEAFLPKLINRFAQPGHSCMKETEALAPGLVSPDLLEASRHLVEHDADQGCPSVGGRFPQASPYRSFGQSIC